MKKYKLILSSFIVFLISCEIVGHNELNWYPNGEVKSSNGKTFQLDLQNIYKAFSAEGMTYLAGFKIDKDGNNDPYLVAIENDSLSVEYWPFRTITNDIFLYKDTLHVNSIEGNVMQYINGHWVNSNLSFPSQSVVSYSDSKNHLVVCYAADIQKTSKRKSGCFSLSPDWNYEFFWFDVEPVFCGDYLNIYESVDDVFFVTSIDIYSGNTVSSKKHHARVVNLCQ